MKMSFVVLALALSLSFSACTKSRSPGNGANNAGPAMSGDPERVIFEAQIELPKKFAGQVKRTDLLIWDLKTDKGEMVAAHMAPVPNFPFHLKVEARQLIKAVGNDAVLFFSARVVKFGDESKPPQKGQLSALEGMTPPKDVVVNPAVDQKRFDKWAKKNQFNETQVLKVGSKLTTELSPIL